MTHNKVTTIRTQKTEPRPKAGRRAPKREGRPNDIIDNSMIEGKVILITG